MRWLSSATPYISPAIYGNATRAIKLSVAPPIAPPIWLYSLPFAQNFLNAIIPELFWPQSMAVDADDNIYITEFGNNRVQKFSSNGSYITKWGAMGGATESFMAPVALPEMAGEMYGLQMTATAYKNLPQAELSSKNGHGLGLRSRSRRSFTGPRALPLTMMDIYMLLSSAITASRNSPSGVISSQNGGKMAVTAQKDQAMANFMSQWVLP